MNRIEIFKPGCHIDMHGSRFCFQPADLAATASTYSPTLYRAPLVIGHPKVEDPAHGWAEGLTVENGRLVAYVGQVSDELKNDAKAGRYGNVSASFYPPKHPGNPAPGAYYLKHIGFLGAAAPAVTGLVPPALYQSLAYSEALAFTGPEMAACSECYTPPPGYTADPDSLALHHRVLAYRAANPEVAYLEAAIALEKATLTLG